MMAARSLLVLVLGLVAMAAEAQAPQGGLSPIAPPVETPRAAQPPPVASPPAPPLASLPVPEPVLFVSEGLEGLLGIDELRAKLAESLGRELVPLVDPRAARARATVWIAASPEHVVVRVTPPQRAEVFRHLPRNGLGPDPVTTVAKAVLDMFWVDAFARLDANEVQDPFCPPGLICVDARRSYPWPPVQEPEVLDPWDGSYRRFYGWDPLGYPPQPPRYGSAALSAPYPGREVHAPPAYWDGPPPRHHGSRRHDYGLSFLTGGGVHKGGAFFRYEFDALRRFRLFDFGLAFIGARGQPEPLTKARRAITALLARRFVSQDFELDLGASFGTFFATFADQGMEVRPYLRAMVTFALPVGPLFDLLVQSDLATTFASVPETGAVEYALSLGLRHRM